MDGSHNPGQQNQPLDQVRQFVARSSGLRENLTEVGSASIFQTTDGKSLSIRGSELGEVLTRVDADGHDFIQVNFRSGRKILVTDTLIGFKPAVLPGLDMAKLPKVVTTPDILSVFEAIQEALHSGERSEEIVLLRKVFDAVVSGGEAVGFNLRTERAWLGRIPTGAIKVVV